MIRLFRAAARVDDRRRLRPDRDRRGHRHPARRADPAHTARWAGRCPEIETRIVDGELQLRAASSPTFFARYLDGERFEEEWWPTGDRVREDERRLPLVRGPRRRPHPLLRLPDRALRGRVGADLPPGRRRGRGGRRPRPRARLRGPRDRRPARRQARPREELARELQEHVKAQTAPYKYPRIVEFAAELPKTASGKIKRAELRGG